MIHTSKITTYVYSLSCIYFFFRDFILYQGYNVYNIRMIIFVLIKIILIIIYNLYPDWSATEVAVSKACDAGFRYRAMDPWHACTKNKILTTRKKEIAQQLLNSKKLDVYFKKHSRDKALLRHDKNEHGIRTMVRMINFYYNISMYVLQLIKNLQKKKWHSWFTVALCYKPLINLSVFTVDKKFTKKNGIVGLR